MHKQQRKSYLGSPSSWGPFLNNLMDNAYGCRHCIKGRDSPFLQSHSRRGPPSAQLTYDWLLRPGDGDTWHALTQKDDVDVVDLRQWQRRSCRLIRLGQRKSSGKEKILCNIKYDPGSGGLSVCARTNRHSLPHYTPPPVILW